MKKSIVHSEIEEVKFILDKLEENDIAILCCQAEVEAVVNYWEN